MSASFGVSCANRVTREVSCHAQIRGLPDTSPQKRAKSFLTLLLFELIAPCRRLKCTILGNTVPIREMFIFLSAKGTRVIGLTGSRWSRNSPTICFVKSRGCTSHWNLLPHKSCERYGAVCLLSALRFHGLTTQAPHQVWIAIAHKCYRQRKATMDDLFMAAKVCRVAGLMQPHLESLA